MPAARSQPVPWITGSSIPIELVSAGPSALGFRHCLCQEPDPVNPEEIKKLTRYFRTKFQLPSIEVRKRMQKKDSAEVYIGDEFIGVIFKDEEDGELSYNFSMAILEFDLD
jgi:hypothetical protein